MKKVLGVGIIGATILFASCGKKTTVTESKVSSEKDYSAILSFYKSSFACSQGESRLSDIAMVANVGAQLKRTEIKNLKKDKNTKSYIGVTEDNSVILFENKSDGSYNVVLSPCSKKASQEDNLVVSAATMKLSDFYINSAVGFDDKNCQSYAGGVNVSISLNSTNMDSQQFNFSSDQVFSCSQIDSAVADIQQTLDTQINEDSEEDENFAYAAVRGQFNYYKSNSCASGKKRIADQAFIVGGGSLTPVNDISSLDENNIGIGYLGASQDGSVAWLEQTKDYQYNLIVSLCVNSLYDSSSVNVKDYLSLSVTNPNQCDLGELSLSLQYEGVEQNNSGTFTGYNTTTKTVDFESTCN